MGFRDIRNEKMGRWLARTSARGNSGRFILPLVGDGGRRMVFAMVAGNDFDGLERLLRPLRRELSFELANALVRLKADDEIQGRYDALADKNTAGTLTPAERAELASLVRANSILGVLKIEARAVLTTTGTGG